MTSLWSSLDRVQHDLGLMPSEILLPGVNNASHDEVSVPQGASSQEQIRSVKRKFVLVDHHVAFEVMQIMVRTFTVYQTSH